MVERSTDRGFALLLALGISFLVAALAIVIGRTLDTRSETGFLELRVVKLRALSDAALAETMAHLNESSTYGGQPRHSLGDGTIGSSVEPTGAGTAHVTATAEWHGWSARLEADVGFDAAGNAHVESWKRILRVGAAHPEAATTTSHLN